MCVLLGFWQKDTGDLNTAVCVTAICDNESVAMNCNQPPAMFQHFKWPNGYLHPLDANYCVNEYKVVASGSG